MKKYISLLLLLFTTIISCSNYRNNNNNTAKLVFVGDIMTHPTIIHSFTTKDVLYPLRDYLKGDIVFANLEFVVNTNKPPMPYPDFNGSIEYLRYFFNYFNSFSVANNHAYDQGPKAESETIEELRKNNKLVLGGSTNSQYIPPTITNINNVNIFISAYTMLDNALSSNTNENGYLYFMNFYPKKYELVEKVKSDLLLATNNEIKIISLHFGYEYTTTPEKWTYEVARELIENGVDIIIGHHPHVPRNVEIYEGTNHSGIIVYSLGNFVSNHKKRYPYLDVGTILSLEINKNKEIQFSYIPTYYAFFYDKNRVIDFEIQAIIDNPNIKMPTLENNKVYSAYDTNAIKSGYNIIHQFYGVLTNDSIKYMFQE